MSCYHLTWSVWHETLLTMVTHKKGFTILLWNEHKLFTRGQIEVLDCICISGNDKHQPFQGISCGICKKSWDRRGSGVSWRSQQWVKGGLFLCQSYAPPRIILLLKADQVSKLLEVWFKYLTHTYNFPAMLATKWSIVELLDYAPFGCQAGWIEFCSFQTCPNSEEIPSFISFPIMYCIFQTLLYLFQLYFCPSKPRNKLSSDGFYGTDLALYVR